MQGPMIEGRVFRRIANRFVVHAQDKAYTCVLKGKLRQIRRHVNSPVVVGDWIRFVPGDGATGAIAEVLPRRSQISRAYVRDPRIEQVIAANVDQILVVQSLRQPDLDLAIVDRCLVIGEIQGLPGVICINKSDLGSVQDYALVLETYPPIGYPVTMTSVEDRTGMESLREHLTGRTTVLIGPTGTGKSSLLNALEPSLRLKVGEVSERDGRGTHTTTWIELLPLTGGGFAIDTPGMQDLDLWGVSPRNLGGCFPEFREPAENCAFSDCAHISEPRCRVRMEVEVGHIRSHRYAHYAATLASVAAEVKPGSAPRGRGRR